MNKRTKLVSLLVAFVMLFSSMAGTLVACDGGNEPCEQHEDLDKNGSCDNCGADVQVPPETKVQYTVSVNTVGGMPLSGVTILTYKGEDDLIAYGDTNDSGIATIKMLPSDDYWFVLNNVPDGYQIQDKYTFNGRSKSITLSSSLVKDERIPSTYGVGDIFHDMTLTLDDGSVVKLSDVLGTEAGKKKAIVLNFWYTTCSWCIKEFPLIDKLAEEYSDSIATFAINTYGESMADVKEFKEDFPSIYNYYHGGTADDLTIDMATAPTALFSAFGSQGYPTTVVIDRYGTICLVVEGAITSESQFERIYSEFSKDNYQQKLYKNTQDFFPKAKPEDVEMPSTEEIGDKVFAEGNDKIASSVTEMHPERDTSDAEYSWPFILDEGGYLKPSNSKYESSFATAYVQLTLQKGDVFAFDYWLSTEAGGDIFYVLVDEVVIYSVSGDSSRDEDSVDGWKKCYPLVAEADGDYTVTFIYNKDGDTDYGDDTVYLDNFRIVEEDDIDVETYLIKYAATNPTPTGYENYVAVVYNEADKYYHVCVNHTDEAGHVCDKNGPLLLANLMGVALPDQDPDNSIFTWANNGELTYTEGGTVINLYDKIVLYCSYASNGTLGTMSPVTLELAELLKKTYEIMDFLAMDDGKEWLQFCQYFKPYGTENQFADPIKGLAPFSAYEAVLNEEGEENIFPNHVTYDRVIMPRGLWFAFTPTVSGAYRITSNSKTGEADGWIFTADRDELISYDHVERFDYIYYDSEENGVDYYMNPMSNVSMVMYFEAGETYYIDIAYYDVYAVGTIDFKIEYMGAEYEIFRYLSPGVFTYNLETNKIIAGGLQVALGDDGYYYVAKTDSDGNYIVGGDGKLVADVTKPVYADFTLATGIFGQPIYVDDSAIVLGQIKRDLISMGAFDFTKTEIDIEGITYLINYAALALSDFSNLTDAEIAAAFTGAELIESLKTLRTTLKNEIAAWDLVAMKSFLENSQFDTLVSFLKANKSAAADKAALQTILDDYSAKLDSYVEALEALGEEKNSANEAALAAATEALEAAETAIKNYIVGILANDATVRAFFEKAGLASATAYVNSYTIKMLENEYLRTDSDDAGRYPDSVSHTAFWDYIEDKVDEKLADNFKTDAEYQAFLGIYKIADLKAGIFHAEAGSADMTDEILAYVENNLITSETEGAHEYTYGCVRVDEALGEILQMLMDYHTFANVENSWVKLCYYWERFAAPASAE